MYAPHPSFLTQPFPAGTGNGILFPWKARWRCSGCWEDVKTRQVKTGGPGSGIDYLFKQEPTGPCQRDTKPQRKYAHCFSRHLLLYIIYINPWSRVYALIMYLYGAQIVGPLRTRYFMLLQQILWAATIVLLLLICADWSLFCWNQRASIIDKHNAQRSSACVTFLDLASMFPLGMKVCLDITSPCH